MTVELLPPIQGRTTCLHCGKHADVYPLDSSPHPGFGGVYFTKDGETILVGQPKDEYDNPDEDLLMQDYENYVLADSDHQNHDWRVRIHGPLWEGTYQRHGDGQWVLIEQGQGFA